MKRGLVHQFAVLARPVAAKAKPGPQRKGRGGRSESAGQRLQRAQKFRLRVWAKARVRADAVKGEAAPFILISAGWPDQMQRDAVEMCRTPAGRRAWEHKWADQLSGLAMQQKIAAAQPHRPAGRFIRPDAFDHMCPAA